MQCLVCELREQRNSMNLSIQKNMEVLNRKWKGYRNPWFALYWAVQLGYFWVALCAGSSV